MEFYTDTALAKGLLELFQRLEQIVNLRVPVNVFLAGGMAVHLYTSERSTTDVDAEFSSVDTTRRVRMHIPNDLVVEIVENGVEKFVYFDTNYNSSFALMHEDYLDDALPVSMEINNFRLHVLSPVDLAVSKISRFADNDREDIAALVRFGLTTADAIQKRADEALPGYIGNETMLRHNIRDAVKLAREAEAALKNDLEARMVKIQTQNLHLTPAWSAEQECRAIGLENFIATATGALLTFAEIASEAIQKAECAAKVDWRQVEDSAIAKSLKDDQQPVEDVYRAIADTSPVALSQLQKAALRDRVNDAARSLGSDPRSGPDIDHVLD